MSKTSSVEQEISRSLRSILDPLASDEAIPDGEDFRQVLMRLEVFVTLVLREIHDEWEGESLDGILVYRARKAGEREVEMLGACYLISDQSVIPLHLRFQLHPVQDEVIWLECRLGEHGDGRMGIRRSHSLIEAQKRLAAADGNRRSLDWSYQVTFGQRQQAGT